MATATSPTAPLVSVLSTSIPDHNDVSIGYNSDGEISEPEPGGYRVSLKTDLLTELEAITTPGSFAAFQPIDDLPPAGLHVSNIGEIEMPLSEESARQLIAQSRQAPFGKRSETLVDTAVRNTWELDASQLLFNNPAWPAFMQKISNAVALELGVQLPIRAELYKMLLYERGAMFKPHTDTQKIPGMFGTLVVCLPSVHQGGEVVVTHAKQRKIYKSSTATQSFICWYSDVSHEVLPVTSGYRWVLTYNLAVDPVTTRPSAELQRSQTRGVRQTLKRWLAEDKATRSNSWLYHVLEHDYTEASISHKTLQRRDRAVVQLLKDVSQELPIEIFIGLLEKEETSAGEDDYGHGYGYYPNIEEEDEDDDEEEDMEEDHEGYTHHDDKEIIECEYTVKTLVDLEGRIVSEGLQLDENDVLLENCFDDLEADEEYEAFMGNEGGTTTQWYRTSAIAIVPHDSLASYFASAARDSHVNAQFGYVARLCLQSNPPPNLFDALEELCKSVWCRAPRYELEQLPYINGENFDMILTSALQSGRYSFFEMATAQHKGHLRTKFFRCVRKWLDEGGDVSRRLNIVRQGLSRAILAYPFAAERYQAMAKLAPLPSIAAPLGSGLVSDAISTPQEILAWVRERCCDQLVAIGEADGAALVDLSFFFNEPFLFLEPRMKSIIVSNPRHEAAYLGFMFRLRELSNKGLFPKDNSSQLYRRLATTFIETVDFTKIRSGPLPIYSSTKPPTLKAYTPAPSSFRIREAVSPKLLSDLFRGILESGTSEDDILTAFVTSLAGTAHGIVADQFEPLWIPFLRCAMATLHATGKPFNDGRYQMLFGNLLKAYLKACVQYEPPTPGRMGLSRRGVDCSCADCAHLNVFLANSTLHSQKFAVNQKRREHLSTQLDLAQVDCTQVTERKRRPHSLVVTKTTIKAKQVHKQWTERLAQAAQVLAQFNQEDMQLLLGSEYQPIMDAEFIRAPYTARSTSRRPRANQQPSLLRQINANVAAQPAVAGAKRKRPAAEPEFVDLTSE